MSNTTAVAAHVEPLPGVQWRWALERRGPAMIAELDRGDGLAYRLLGRFAEAADAVGEARRKIEKAGEPGWLGTVVARVSREPNQASAC